MALPGCAALPYTPWPSLLSIPTGRKLIATLWWSAGARVPLPGSTTCSRVSWTATKGWPPVIARCAALSANAIACSYDASSVASCRRRKQWLASSSSQEPHMQVCRRLPHSSLFVPCYAFSRRALHGRNPRTVTGHAMQAGWCSASGGKSTRRAATGVLHLQPRRLRCWCKHCTAAS